MRRIASCLLLVASCYDPVDPVADTESSDDTTASSGEPTTVTTTMTTTATTTMSSATTPTTSGDPTTSPDTSAESTATDTVSESGSESESGTTEPLPECEDGQFVGDAPPFGGAVLIAQLDNAQGVEIVDVDGDDDADVLVGDFGDGGDGEGGVYYIEGNGDGTFQPAVKLPGGTAPTVRIAAAAIADDTIDVVGMVAEPPDFQPTVYRWRGNGDGTFLAPVSYDDASNWDVALVDVDSDGRRDLLGTAQGGARVSLSNASEAFGAFAEVGGLDAINGIKGRDLDGDDYGDIVAGSADQVIVLIGNGDGSVGAPLTYALDFTPSDVLIADLDGDGAIDIGATSGAVVSVFPGDGKGAWGERVDLTVQGDTLAAATPDFDGDGCDDIAVINNTGSVSTILGREGFMFTPQEIFNIVPVGYAYDIASGDVDGDQIADVVAVTAGASADEGGEVFLLRSGA